MSAALLKGPVLDRDVLHVAEEVEAPSPPFPPDTGVSTPAERRFEIAHEEAIHPYRARHDGGGHALGTRGIARVHDGSQSIGSAVGELDRLAFRSERLPGKHGTEHFIL